MKWKNRRRSSNVEDRRGQSPAGGYRGGGIGIPGVLMGGGGIGALLIYLLFSFFGGRSSGSFDGANVIDQTTNGTYETAEEDELFDYVSVILADTEDIWTDVLADYGYTYEAPKLVVYNEMVQSACGVSGASTGPFYCPADEKLYIDLSFYDELRDQFQAPGDFAMAYVVAHEVGHHVQNQLGLADQFQRAQSQASQEQANAMSVQFELQADYLAGVWAHYAEGMGYLEEGDYEEAITAAGAVGDDRIQMQAQGYVVPESFTHGTAKQRMYWFEKGFQSGRLEEGNTFE
ncbi:KPN_02809 family neutral zinc metallopeptidase [Pisciglobus halotolerans]|uniref:Metalloprotease n=1 Tax=Pisciglobus halotolerans TaxID=745365 RepID=A0A1I3AN15_9LACT|nr:neutral zinc metallopeptidase [Pisciglobus halotolerans]SFH51099.1 hypothetical protein SAMN04489868_10126 [Pisciglobus halotolerans]